MKTSILTAAALVLVLPVFAWAQDNCANPTDQATLNQCAAASFKKSDKKLNEIYKQIETRLKDDPEIKQLLVKAQHAWVGFRDAECSFATAEAAGGSMVPMLVAQCQDGLTQSRVKAFEAYLNCKEGDMSCPVPAVN